MAMDFYQRVGVVCREIRKGKVATYGQIALLCGKPQNSRQVGYALNRGLAGPDIPAHRVVNHQGYLTGAKAFETDDAQKKLLETEHVEVTEERPGIFRAALSVYGWKTTLDEAETFYRMFQGQDSSPGE